MEGIADNDGHFLLAACVSIDGNSQHGTTYFDANPLALVAELERQPIDDLGEVWVDAYCITAGIDTTEAHQEHIA